MRNDLHKEEMENAALAQSAIDVLLPVLTILEEADVPVKGVYWRQYWKCIDLAEEMKLTQEAFDALIDRGVKYLSQSLEGTSITFRFKFKGVCFSIDNARNTCKVKKITEMVPVPARMEERVRYEQIGNCAVIDTGGD